MFPRLKKKEKKKRKSEEVGGVGNSGRDGEKDGSMNHVTQERLRR